MDRYIHHYVRNLKGARQLTPDEIEQTGKDFSHFRVSWDGQYFDFSYDHHIFHPIEGKSSLLARSADSGPTIVIKQYTIQEFLELTKDASQLIVFIFPEGLQFTPLAGITYNYVSEGNSDLFPIVKIYKYTDYNKLLIKLEERGCISSIPSQNLIASIDKRFQITPKAVKLCPFLKDYADHFYEADCVGTQLHRTFTILLEDVYQSVVN